MNYLHKVRKAIREGGVSLLVKRFFNKIFWSMDRQEYLSHVHHKVVKPLPNVQVEHRPTRETTEDDVIMVERLLTALKRARADEQKSVTGDLWDRIQEEHGEFYAIMNNPTEVAGYMHRMNHRSITMGIATSTLSEYVDMKKYPKVQQEWGIFIKDNLMILAESIGALPYNLKSDVLYADSEYILALIEDKIGTQLRPRDIEGGLYKMRIGDRFFDPRDFWSAYLAWRVRDLVGTDAKVAEIGGGMGKAALYAHDFGIKDYSIYDLPIINFVQGWYLLKSGLKVNLYGEKQRPDSIGIYPYWMFTTEESFDLVLNADSFPEMDASIVENYLRKIVKNTKKYLLSINQEEMNLYGEYGKERKHVFVQDVVQDIKGLRRIQRSPFWFLKDYVEELYTIDKSV